MTYQVLGGHPRYSIGCYGLASDVQHALAIAANTPNGRLVDSRLIGVFPAAYLWETAGV